MLEILYFSAPWCGPCKALKPIIDKIKSELDSNKVLIKRINVDDEAKLSIEHEISSVPTFIFIKDKKIVGRFTGVKSMKEIQSLISKWS
jgi:thioredoxin 1